MSSYGDFCREQRKARQRVRMFWHECPHCAQRFGTGTSVAPGGNCRNCGWDAPGQPGDDMRAADDLERRTWSPKSKQRGDWNCPYCEMSFATRQARGSHVNKKHGAEHIEKRANLKRQRFDLESRHD